MSEKDERSAANEKPKLRANPPAAAACPECGGSGRVVLLTSSRACARCGGAGGLDTGGGIAERTVEAPDGWVRTYDGHGRLTREVWPGNRARGPKDARGSAEGPESYVYTYDDQGRLLTLTRTGTDRTVFFGYPESGTGNALDENETAE